MEMTPDLAREFWKALMDNAASLISDAEVLLQFESWARARSLTVLAQEELGKAIWVYEVFQVAWNIGETSPRNVTELTQHSRAHTRKYLEAFVFGDELASFWGDYDTALGRRRDGESWREAAVSRAKEASAAATAANRDKQSGFYVDLTADGIVSPAQVDQGSIAQDLQTAAQVVEMLLIKDHSRMKFDATTPYDSTHAQQSRLLPIAHPEDWAAATRGSEPE
jgi:AbiV family abortive infection protein